MALKKKKSSTFWHMPYLHKNLAFLSSHHFKKLDRVNQEGAGQQLSNRFNIFFKDGQ